jgi:hypothetical protein
MKKSMLLDILIVFVIITILLFIISVIMVEENPAVSIILIIAGMIFSIFCVFGFGSVDVMLGDGTLVSDTSYYETFGWAFFFFFLFYALLFIKAGFNYMQIVINEGSTATKIR